MDCSGGSPEDWKQEHLLITSAEAIVLAATSAAARAAWKEALAMVFPSSITAENFCLESCDNESLNFAMESQMLSSYFPKQALLVGDANLLATHRINLSTEQI